MAFKSPTTPRSATSKIGAPSSLFTAMIRSDSSIPAKCWMAPEIPNARYNSGRTVLPVCPTCWDFSIHPESTAALEEEISAPSSCARPSKASKPSGPPKPRPPDTRTLASVMSFSCFRFSGLLLSERWVRRG